MTATLLALATALVPFLIWYVQRRLAPAPEERMDSAGREVAAMRTEVDRARRAGDHARADALLRRLYQRAVAPVPRDRPDGQRDPGHPPGRDDSATTLH